MLGCRHGSPLGHLTAAVVLAAFAGCAGSNDVADFQAPPPPPFAVEGGVTAGFDEQGPVPLAGAEVCLLPGTECTSSGGDGLFQLDAFPALTEVTVSISKPGFLGVVVPFPPVPNDPLIIDFVGFNLSFPVTYLLTDDEAALLVRQNGGTYPLASTGIVQVSVFDRIGGFDLSLDAILSISPSAAGIVGPVAFDFAILPLGGVGFLNVPAGDVEISVAVPGYSCIPPGGIGTGWVGTVDGALSGVRAPVAAGALTALFVQCDPAPQATGSPL